MPKVFRNSRLESAVGQRLKEAREAFGISQPVLAAKLGYGRERISSYESGRVHISLKAAQKIVDTFNISPLWLATGEGGMWTGKCPPAFSRAVAKNETFRCVVLRLVEEGAKLTPTQTSGPTRVDMRDGFAPKVSFLSPAQREAHALLAEQLPTILEAVPESKAGRFAQDLVKAAQRLAKRT